MAHEPDRIDIFIDRMLEKLDRWIYGTPQNLGKWAPPVASSEQGKEETPGTPTSKSTTQTI